MSLNAYDVKIFVWKVIKVSTTTCLNVSRKHSYVTSCFLFLFILYLCCPLFFWILIYSLPLAVSTWVVLNIRESRRCKEEREIERQQKERESGRKVGKEAQFVASDSDDHGEEGEEEEGKIMKKGFSRVHSVRRRRAMELACEDERAEAKNNVIEELEEEGKAILSTADKSALVEESPKKGEVVEVEKFLTNADPGADVSIDEEVYQNSDLVKSLKLLKEEEDARDEASKAMDANLAEAEKNERLQSLIARRRSQKTPSLQVRKPLQLLNTDDAAAAAAPILIPKINTRTTTSPTKNTGPHSPGSAPSVLVPMRNPFDLPYDPQEEKPDLTGDSFQQEFTFNRDFMFCRHNSFSLGPSLPMDFFEDRRDGVDDFGFRRRRSSIGTYHRFPKPQHEESDTDMGMTTEEGEESECNIGSGGSGGQSFNDTDNNSIKATATETETERHNNNPLDELSLSSKSSRSSVGSSEDEDQRPPICKINREAILKSLSMRRNSVSVEMESNDQLQENNLSYANSALENASRLKQQYFADKPQKRHGMTFSIASDMQVEVSEISSPPLTIGENMSYQDDASASASEMERNASWDGLDSWAGSSRVSETDDNETRPMQVGGATRSNDTTTMSYSYGDEEKHCITSSSSAADLSLNESQATRSNDDTTMSTSASASASASPESNEQQPAASEEAKSNTSGSGEASTINQATEEGGSVHHATISPKSVLQPTLSVASFDHEGDDEAQQSGPHPLDPSTSNAPQNSDNTASQQELASEPPTPSDEQEKIRKNDEKLKGVADEKAAETRDESSSSTSNAADSSVNENQNNPEQVSGSSQVAAEKETSSLPSEKEMGNEENDSSKKSTFEEG